MRRKSHLALGNYLLTAYSPELSDISRKAFLLGCIEPDRNPASYLKGSLRCQFLHGHNYGNAAPFVQRKLQQLSQKVVWNLWNWYTLGKIIHYTADAFTYPHNENYPGDLAMHRIYEIRLQKYFLSFLDAAYCLVLTENPVPEDIISSFHGLYVSHPGSLERDSEYALSACCHILSAIIPQATKNAVK